MSEIKLVLADLDGTAVQPEANTATDEVIASIRNAQQRGVKFAAVTGRPFAQAKTLLESMGIKDPCIFDGGAIIANPTTGEVMWSRSIPVETTRAAVSAIIPFASVIDYGAGRLTPEQIDIKSITDEVLSIWASVPADKVDIVSQAVSKLPGVAVHINPGPGGDFSRSGVQVTNIEADKEHAVAALLGKLGIDKEHTLAIGDGDNDIPLVESAKIKVAMGNASPNLKAHADHVVASVSKNGLSEAIDKFLV